MRALLLIVLCAALAGCKTTVSVGNPPGGGWYAYADVRAAHALFRRTQIDHALGTGVYFYDDKIEVSEQGAELLAVLGPAALEVLGKALGIVAAVYGAQIAADIGGGVIDALVGGGEEVGTGDVLEAVTAALPDDRGAEAIRALAEP